MKRPSSEGIPILKHALISFCRDTAGSTSGMSSALWEQWPLMDRNGSSLANPIGAGCFNSSQNTVLIGTEFEGVPIVLLLDFIAFLVGVGNLVVQVYALDDTRPPQFTKLILNFCDKLRADEFSFSFHPQVLLSLFSIIRRKFWDYGRLALVADNEGSVQSLQKSLQTMIDEQ